MQFAELLDGRRGICSFRQRQAIRATIESYATRLDRIACDLGALVPLIYLASQFGITSPAIHRVVSIVCPRVDLYSIVYVKRFDSHELMLQQYITALRDRLGADELRARRDQPVEVHFLAGTIVGFAFADHQWRAGERVVFRSEISS
jgi:hypothetical protein